MKVINDADLPAIVGGGAVKSPPEANNEFEGPKRFRPYKPGEPGGGGDFQYYELEKRGS